MTDSETQARTRPGKPAEAAQPAEPAEPAQPVQPDGPAGPEAPGVTVREAVFELCRRTGMTTVFGNPGSTELRMFRDWPRDFRYVLGLQESTAVAMAAGHALGTGSAALVSLHSAGGVGHSLGAVFNAYRDRVPVVIVAGQQSRALLPTHPFLGADEPAMFPRPYVKWSRQPERAEDVPAALAEAHRVAMTHPRGPVFLSVPEDDWDAGPVPYVAPRQLRDGFVAEPSALAELAARLDTATAPALVIGPGVEDDCALEEVVALAERLRAAAWISPLSGRSGFPETHPLFQGFLPPVPEQLAARLGAYDVVIAIGAPLFTYHVQGPGPHLPDGTELFHLDCDPEQAAWLPVGTSVLTTVRAGVRALTGLVARSDREPPPVRSSPPPAPAGNPIAPALVMDLLRRTLPDGTVIVEETPSHRATLHERLPVTRAGGFLTTGSGALGWGLPLAVGRALADTEKEPPGDEGTRGGSRADGPERVVCVVGDGSALYSVQALWTAARHHAPVTYVLLDNRGYEAVRSLGRRIGIDAVPGTGIEGIDFAALASSLGCPADRVETADALPAALAHALAPEGGGPALLEVRVGDEESALYGPEPWAR
ncbi:benzoylformate decarboxylase [Streptomyces sp. HNM0575]|uniref:benzoylformate decarboxylase n=1 Tax=Streptomyces sp. HNM0575 TaxID=2716338 RepID=UPI00145E99DB|nr:benzoylformate decarboxylase [Streptomyces sp. HNM0575]NLU74327.1 benzoylformate decarboxylase [Streptomyces sp. HNM0575]